jgi:serine/threonine-protein kinase CTR1
MVIQGSLFDLLHKRKLEITLSWKERFSFALEIAQGMEFLHLMKPIIIHRDLKSLNVLVAKNDKNEWKMRIADFGLSRSPEADMMTTQLGTIVIIC